MRQADPMQRCGRGGWFARALLAAGLLLAAGAPALAQQSVTRTTTYSYAAAPLSNRPAQRVIQPGDAAALTTQWSYDSFGNAVTTTTSGAAIPANTATANQQVVSTPYGPAGVFPASSTIAVKNFWLTQNFVDTPTIEPMYGREVAHSDPNGLVTTHRYDVFGRATNETRPDGNQTEVSYYYCAGGLPAGAVCPATAAYMLQATPQDASSAQNGEQIRTYYDALDRVVRREGQLLIPNVASNISAGQVVPTYADTTYDAVTGNVARQSRPYIPGGSTAYWSARAYDALGRLTTLTHEDGTTITTGYAGRGGSAGGMTTTVTDELSHVTTTTSNSIGEIVATTDALGHITTFQYEPFGNIAKIVDPTGQNVTSASYTARGWRSSLDDPDVGHWSYSYDALGELTGYTDAKGNTTQQTYDVLGRMTSQQRADVSNWWRYDHPYSGTTTPSYLGRLVTAFTTQNPPYNYPKYYRMQAYDALMRLASIKLQPDPESVPVNAPNTATTTIGYDGNGRVAQVTRPSGNILNYAYDQLGQPLTLSYIPITNGTPTVAWAVWSRDPEKHVTKETNRVQVVTNRTYDNRGRPTHIVAQEGYKGSETTPPTLVDTTMTWYANGLLQCRTALIPSSDANTPPSNIAEQFLYDPLNRLTATNQLPAVGCGSAGQLGWLGEDSASYDAAGNITAKASIGTYSYPAPGSPQPHAVTSVSGTPNLSFAYDANGNMTTWSGTNPAGTAVPTTLSYTNDNPVQSISQGSGYVLGFRNAPEGVRARMTTGTATAVAATTYYMGFDPLTHSELRIAGTAPAAATTQPTWVDYLEFGGELIGEVTITCSATPCTQANATGKPTMFHPDHLGSILALSDGNTAGNGTFTAQSYDSWGARRPVSIFNRSGTPAGTIVSAEHRGYIGEEVLDQLGLLNLNRRLYDPRLGRFLAADPIASGFFGDPQQLNRYAYARNQPLNMVDRDGRYPIALSPLAPLAGPFAPVVEAALIGATIGILGYEAVNSILHNESVDAEQPTSQSPPAASNPQAGGVTIPSKIAAQLTDRGWTVQDVQNITNTPPAGTTTDNTTDSATGQKRNDPASVYGGPGGYVVVNDANKQVIQVSDKTDPGWLPDGRIQWGSQPSSTVSGTVGQASASSSGAVGQPAASPTGTQPGPGGLLGGGV